MSNPNVNKPEDLRKRLRFTTEKHGKSLKIELKEQSIGGGAHLSLCRSVKSP